MTKKEFSDLWFNEWKFCGWESPEDALSLLRDVLNMLNKQCYGNENVWKIKYGAIEAMLGNHINQGLYWTYLYWLDSIGLTEHGGSVSSSWLTDHGKKVLEFLQSLDMENDLDDFNEWGWPEDDEEDK